MNIFDKFLNTDVAQPSGTVAKNDEHWDRQKRKEIGMKREKSAIHAIRRLLYRPENFLHGLHFIEPTTKEICEVDGLYLAKDALCIVEIKSKNFDYMYGNTDTGHWYLEYGGRIVKSDNAFRQITRQMRIAKANLGMNVRFLGIVFLNNRNPNARIDVVGNELKHISLELDATRVAKFLNSLPNNDDANLAKRILEIDEANRESGLYD